MQGTKSEHEYKNVKNRSTSINIPSLAQHKLS